MKKLLFLFLILFAINASVISAEPFNKPRQKKKSVSASNFTSKNYAKNKRGLVQKLLNITGAKKQVEEILKTMTDVLPKGTKQAFIDPLDPDEMVKQVIPVYERYLSISELQAIIQFYKTPAGKKLLKAQPKIMEDSMVVMKVYVQKKLEESMNKNLKE